jgi:hypothetical protein
MKVVCISKKARNRETKIGNFVTDLVPELRGKVFSSNDFM